MIPGSESTLTAERMVFNCPVCGVHHDGPLVVSINAEVTRIPVEGLSARPEWVAMVSARTLSTSACQDTFVVSDRTEAALYRMTMFRYLDGRPDELRVEARVSA